MKHKLLLAALLLGSVWMYGQSAPQGLQVNDKAPVFRAKDQNGKTLLLGRMLRHGPVVLMFYRGQWCPYCNRQLKALQDSLQLFSERKVRVVAVTPETKANVAKTVGKTGASFSVVSDSGMAIMKAYGVTFAVDEATQAKYKGYGLDFAEMNGTNGAMLPVPAVYIIGKDGTIQYRFFNTDYTKRPSVMELLAAL
jgi:peroxiredoxin